MQWIYCSMLAAFIRVEVFFCPQCKFVSYLGVCGLIIRRRLSAATDDYGDDHDHDDVEDDVDYGDDDHDDGDVDNDDGNGDGDDDDDGDDHNDDDNVNYDCIFV